MLHLPLIRIRGRRLGGTEYHTKNTEETCANEKKEETKSELGPSRYMPK
jgi:hypothetical protein